MSIFKAAIYVRVSTEEQAREGFSVSGQLQKLKAFCISQEWDVAGVYADEGISAKDMERPQLQKMLKSIEQGEVDCVLVYRLDRLTRSVLDLYKMLETFERYDCKFKSATEVYDTTTAMGRMFITIVAALAQWERENLGERVSFGFAEKHRQGKYAHSIAPIGYDLDRKTSKLHINHSEAKTIKRIFDLYQSGLGMNRVSAQLNKEGDLTKQNNPWNDKTIMKVLRNPVYCGDTRWRDVIVENTHEGIITKEKWQDVQLLIEQRRTAQPRSVSSNYIFSGKLKCLSCGRPLVGYYTSYKQNKYYQYRCREKLRGRCAGSKSISEIELEKSFVEYLETKDFNEIVNPIADTGIPLLNKKEPTIDVDSLESKLQKLEQRKKKWQYAWTEDLITDNDFKKRMGEAKQEEELIREQIDSVVKEPETENINKEQIIKALQSIKRNWFSLERSEKKKLVNSIVNRIDYYRIGSKTIGITHIDIY